MRAVRHALLAGDDTSEFDFVSLRPFDDATLLLETRVAIARFFDVPTTRINRDVQLVDDLRVDKLEPFFQFSVVKSVIASQRIEPEPFGFSMAGIETIDDLTAAIRHVINGFDRNIKDQGKPES
ncbi:hypothetical protein [Bremerella sp.]|uniref:hypothetical protein n=1 Tax=Bremerella sp. TaxID=2795602 RepID=UPI00391C8F22